MTLRRITSMLGAVALGGVLVASTYGAQAATSGPRPAPAHSVRVTFPFHAPVPHKYGSNGMRMGLHCDSSDVS